MSEVFAIEIMGRQAHEDVMIIGTHVLLGVTVSSDLILWLIVIVNDLSPMREHSTSPCFASKRLASKAVGVRKCGAAHDRDVNTALNSLHAGVGMPLARHRKVAPESPHFSAREINQLWDSVLGSQAAPAIVEMAGAGLRSRPAPTRRPVSSQSPPMPCGQGGSARPTTAAWACPGA